MMLLPCLDGAVYKQKVLPGRDEEGGNEGLRSPLAHMGLLPPLQVLEGGRDGRH